MIEPNDVMKVDDENWEEFKKEAAKDELYYNGPGDILDTPEGRSSAVSTNPAYSESPTQNFRAARYGCSTSRVRAW